jgi:hypothetical protein
MCMKKFRLGDQYWQLLDSGAERAKLYSFPGHAQRSGGQAYHSPDGRRAGTPRPTTPGIAARAGRRRPTLTKTGTVLIERHAAQLLPCSAGGAQGDQATKGLEHGGTDCIQWPLSGDIRRVHSRRSQGCSGSGFRWNPPRGTHPKCKTSFLDVSPGGCSWGCSLGGAPGAPRGGFHLEPLPDHPLERLL